MIKKIKDNIFQLNFNNFGSCVYLIKNEKNILIDSSSNDNSKELIQDLKEIGLEVNDIEILLLTHNHWDHIGNNDLFENSKIYDFENINNFKFKGMEIFKVPGHTKDSLAFLYNKVLFSGDTLFDKGIGRTDFSESEPEKMQKSLELLRNLDYEFLAPGHI